MTENNDKQLFDLGVIVCTPGILELAKSTGFKMEEFIDRHSKGDWGDMSEQDIKTNEESLRDSLRLFSAYVIPTGHKIWIITERDRSVTTVLLPDEY